METIHESTNRTAGPPAVASEEAEFSAIRPSQLRSTEALMSAIDNLAGRSVSLKVPLQKKPSLRAWVKRSNTSHTTRKRGLEAPDSPLKAHIKHLGGGRIEEVRVKGTASNTTLLAPVPIRPQRSRAGSSDSRVTQWLDFYNGPADIINKQSSSPNQVPMAAIPPHGFQSSSGLACHELNRDLRPAPLRVPSSERAKAAVTSPSPSSSRPLERKDSKWKPLPSLPVHGSGPKQRGVSTPASSNAATRARRGPQAAGSEAVVSGAQHTPAWESGDQWLLPALTFGSPPPTPDSDAGGAARAQVQGHKPEGKGQNGIELCPGRATSSLPLDVLVEKDAQQKGEATGQIKHTREERIWLHVNYRGEAPFLQAWGLDITKLEERLQGLAIVRELMQAESGNAGARDTATQFN